MEIKFTDTLGVPKEYSPKLSSAFVPDWYKKLESYISGEKKPTGQGMTTATAKRCMPVFDAITSGYIILSAADVFVSQKEAPDGTKQPWFEWSTYGLIQFHPIEQMPEHPQRNGHMAYPKWINPWAIKTPKGYSVLFTQPMHRESPFTILPGIVDTDTYSAPVNFPFVLNDINFEGLIPAGTPIAQVIPIKRDEWQMSLGTQAEFIEQQQVTNRLNTKFFDRYKSMFRQTKEYK
jgi:hypothetical protein